MAWLDTWWCAALVQCGIWAAVFVVLVLPDLADKGWRRWFRDWLEDD